MEILNDADRLEDAIILVAFVLVSIGLVVLMMGFMSRGMDGKDRLDRTVIFSPGLRIMMLGPVVIFVGPAILRWVEEAQQSMPVPVDGPPVNQSDSSLHDHFSQLTTSIFIIAAIIVVVVILALIVGAVILVKRTNRSPEVGVSGVGAPAVRYGDLLGRFNVVEREFAAVETDPEFLLSHPAIRDVTVPATAAFHRARRVAAEVVDVASVSLEATASEGDIEAIDALEKAWEDAMRVAEAMVENGISVAMRSRAQRLLDRIVAPANEHELEADKRALAAILDNITYTDSSTGAIKRLNGTAIITHIPQHALAGAKLQEISSSCEK